MFTSQQFTSPVGLGKIAITSFVIGVCFTSHFLFYFAHFPIGKYCYELLRYYGETYALQTFAFYMMCCCFFHFSEFLITAAFKPGFVSYDSFLINHSTAYTIAFVASQVEFWVETICFPHWKMWQGSIALGIFCILLGHFFRIGAMWTAKSNFSHIIETSKRKEHMLITHGVYRYVRHPSYLGWFWWSIGTQLLLCNPVCTVCYTIASWDFFRHRIPYVMFQRTFVIYMYMVDTRKSYCLSFFQINILPIADVPFPAFPSCPIDDFSTIHSLYKTHYKASII